LSKHTCFNLYLVNIYMKKNVLYVKFVLKTFRIILFIYNVVKAVTEDASNFFSNRLFCFCLLITIYYILIIIIYNKCYYQSSIVNCWSTIILMLHKTILVISKLWLQTSANWSLIYNWITLFDKKFGTAIILVHRTNN